MKSPYVFVGGRIEAEGNNACFSISQNGKIWQRVAGNSLDRFFSVTGPACYQYQLKCELNEGTLKKLAIVNDLQMAPHGTAGDGGGRKPLHLQRRDAGDAKGPYYTCVGGAFGGQAAGRAGSGLSGRRRRVGRDGHRAKWTVPADSDGNAHERLPASNCRGGST